MKKENADVVVIGAGPAGYVCAIRLAQLGKKVTVIERESVGGVCLNVGCIPSKALIHAGSVFEKIKHADTMGIKVGSVSLDFTKLIQWKNQVVQKLTGGVGQLLKANGCTLVSGDASFESSDTLLIKSQKETYQLKFNQCVIATGSRPFELSGFKIDQKNILDSTGALSLPTLPKSLLCIGGGYIGLELGTFYAKCGTTVTVMEGTQQLLGTVDADLVRVVQKGLTKRGVSVKLGTKVVSSQIDSKGVKVTFIDETGAQKSETFEKVLVTVGRVPNTDSLALAKAGLKADAKGFLTVDASLRTNQKNIFAIGDVAGQPLLAHKGSKEGLVAADVIAGKNVVYDVKAMPAVVFTDPEVATVGLTEQEAKQKYEINVGTFPFVANGRALSMNESEGLVKLISDKKSGTLLGCHIVGPEASNLIAEAALAIEMGAHISDLALTVHAHPTLPETLMEAAESAMGHAIHIFQPKSQSASFRSPPAHA